MQSEVDAAIKKLQELKLVLGEHQKVSSSAAMQPGGLQTHSAPTPGDSHAGCWSGGCMQHRKHLCLPLHLITTA